MTPVATTGRWLAEARATADAEAAAARAHDARRVDRDVTIVLLVAAVALTLNHFLSQDGTWLVSAVRALGAPGLARRLDQAFNHSAHAQFWLLVEWAVVQVTTYVVPAVLTIKLVLHSRVRDFGVRVRGIGPFLRPYVALYLIVVPFLFVASFSAEFQSRYPFYDLAPHEHFWPYLWCWWGLYALQFMALEFFFRGFLVHGLVPRFGWLAVPVMVVPYNMLHYGKPMPEALAAIVGGLVLGTLAIRTRSIWWGAALHISIAASMDLLSLWQHGRLF
jgi:membrane protease YdiL (CAAX protease family)